MAPMTPIDLIIDLGQAFWSRRPHFLTRRSVIVKLCTVYIFQSVLPLLLFSS